jgi:hypothetical protein
MGLTKIPSILDLFLKYFTSSPTRVVPKNGDFRHGIQIFGPKPCSALWAACLHSADSVGRSDAKLFLAKPFSQLSMTQSRYESRVIYCVVPWRS